MDSRYSFRIYPRIDKVFTHKKSLNFDLMRTKIMKHRPDSSWEVFMSWVAYALAGILTGFTASIMVFIEDNLTDLKRNTADKMIKGNDMGSLFASFAFFVCFSMALVFLAAAMTVFYGPGAVGSGVAELIAHMNGVNYPKVFGFPTFITKVFAVVFAVVGGLTVGKEGPLAHIGANCAVFTAYLPFRDFDRLRNDVEKRALIAAGTSAGVAAAFGAPVGGTLFAYEMSKPNTFWRFQIIWKVFFTCAFSVFSLAFFSGIWNIPQHGTKGILDLNSASLKFGSEAVTAPTLKVLPAAFIVGILSGLLGALFVIVNNWMGFFRKYYVKNSWLKVFEAVAFSFMISSTTFWAPFMFPQCIDRSKVSENSLDAELLVSYTCPEGKYSTLATMLFNTEGSAIKTLISGQEQGGIIVNAFQMFIYLSIWYLWTIITYGVWVPAGLFLPGMIIGCALGSFYECIWEAIFNYNPDSV